MITLRDLIIEWFNTTYIDSRPIYFGGESSKRPAALAGEALVGDRGCLRGADYKLWPSDENDTIYAFGWWVATVIKDHLVLRCIPNVKHSRTLDEVCVCIAHELHPCDNEFFDKLEKHIDLWVSFAGSPDTEQGVRRPTQGGGKWGSSDVALYKRWPRYA